MSQKPSEEPGLHRANIRFLFKELLAWVIFDREQHCRVEYRWDIDGQVAEAFIDANPGKIDYLVRQTSLSIPREAFALRFLDFVGQCYAEMRADRARWLPPSFYG